MSPTRLIALLVTLVVTPVVPRPASACGVVQFPGEMMFEKTPDIPVQGLYAAGGLGWQVASALSAQGELGYAWGSDDTSMFGSTNVTHVSVAPRVSSDTNQTDLNLALMIGVDSYDSLFSLGISAGVDLRFADEMAIGPTGKLRAGGDGFYVYLLGGVLFAEDDTDFHLSLGVEFLLVPHALDE